MSLVTKRPPSAAVAHGAPHAAKVDLSSLGDALGIKPKKACKVLDCGTTHVYDLMKKRELESYLDGRSRKITTASIREYVTRRLAASNPQSGALGGSTLKVDPRCAAEGEPPGTIVTGSPFEGTTAGAKLQPRRRGRPPKLCQEAGNGRGDVS
jgi:excisionase family DNA binding protein